MVEEHEHSMVDMHKYEHACPQCGTVMPRYYSGKTTVVFKGDGWVDKQLRREKEDNEIQRSRRQATRLKTSGAVPWKEQIKIKTAPGLYDRLGTEMRKKEAERAESGEIDTEMSSQVSED